MLRLMLLMGLVLATLAAPMAFLITYEERSHHLLPRRVIFGHALEAAAVTWVFFFGMALILGVILNRMLGLG